MQKKPLRTIPERVGTQQHIANVTEVLMESNSIEDISVKSIIDASHTSRTTFYRYFKDKYDVIIWIYCTSADRLIAQNLGFAELTLKMLQFMAYHRNFIISAFSYERQNSLVDYIYQRSIEDCLKRMYEGLNLDVLPAEIEYSVEFFVGGCCATWKRWIFSGMKEAPEFIQNVIVSNMPENLRPYLIEGWCQTT